MGCLVLEVSRGDLAFKHMGIFADNTSSVSFKRPSAADSATLKISKQIKGRMGQTIHQKYINPEGAVACLACRVHHILSNGGSDSQLIYDVRVKGH